MRRILITLGLATSGCSLGIRPPDAAWTGASDPDCDVSNVRMVGDLLLASAGVVVGVVGIVEDNTGLLVAGTAGAALFGVGFAFGADNTTECQRQHKVWRAGRMGS